MVLGHIGSVLGLGRRSHIFNKPLGASCVAFRPLEAPSVKDYVPVGRVHSTSGVVHDAKPVPRSPVCPRSEK